MASSESLHLCSNCIEIDVDKLSSNCGHVVSRNYDSLERSARHCVLCRLLLRRLEWGDLNHHMQLSLFLKSHNPNCIDKYGAAELELRQRVPQGAISFASGDGLLLGTLGVYVEPNSDAAKKNIFSGRPVPEDPSSEYCYSTLRGWIDSCCSEHANCPNQVISRLPKRVIDVGSSDGLTDPYLHESNGESGTWIALSHQWGGESCLTTTSTTLNARKKCIPFESLPKSFQDAVVVTRNLKVRFLWIDSLCVLQGSGEDWKAESADMGRIYKDSLCTIAASEAENCEFGFLQSRSPIWLPSDSGISGGFCKLDPVKTAFTSPSTGVTGNLWVRRALQPYKFVMQGHLMPTNKLQKRGWVLQETLLSPRTLHYTKEQIFWQCRTCAFAEGDADIVEFNYWPDYEWQNDKTFLTTSEVDWKDTKLRSPNGWVPPREYYSIQTNWLRLINDYACRQLKFQTDKLPAISGIATEYGRLTKDTYIAGIWTNDIHRGLLWTGSGSISSENYRAPSWSWASRDLIDDRHKHYSRMIEMERISMSPLHETYLMASHTSSPFGSLVSGYIALNGRCLLPYAWNLISSAPSSGTLERGTSGTIKLSPAEEASKGTIGTIEISLDWKVSPPSADIWREELCCILLAKLKHYKGRNENPYHALALCKRGRSPELDDTWVRIGIAKLDAKAALYHDGWQRRTLKIF